MKKLLLLVTFLFSTSVFFAQGLNQPSLYNNVCDDNNDGFSSFYLGEISFEIVQGLNAADYTITHHETLTDATLGANSLSSPYMNTNPFTQVIHARVVTNSTGAVQIVTYNLNVNLTPLAITQTLTNCADVTTSFSCWNLQNLEPVIIQGQPNLFVSFHQTFTDAQLGVNAIGNPACYISPSAAPISPPVFYLVQNTQTGCSAVGIVELITIDCSNPLCPTPSNLTVSSITTNSAVVGWTDTSGATAWEISLSVAGTAPTSPIVATSNPYIITGLACGSSILVTVRALCTPTQTSGLASTSFNLLGCNEAGVPQNLIQCVDAGLACFNLSDNDINVIGTLNPSDYTITYHTTEIDANNDANPITAAYCMTALGTQQIFVRLENNTTSEHQLMVFSIIGQVVSPTIINLPDMDSCDDNNDGTVSFNFTNVQAQIGSTNVLEYYPSLANAQNQVVPFANPSAVNIASTNAITNVFVREIVPGGCDTIYTFKARAFAICNLAYVCNQANSLCSALGIPFSNTVGSSSVGSPGCLGSAPNPTWFYLPVSTAGTIGLMIQQSTDLNFSTNNLDVDYVVYGPFTDPITPCGSGLPLESTIVSCSYSAAPVEYPTITGALPGQYYLIMTTNFSNQPGYIKITQTSGSSGTINCSGLLLNAFLDSNSNGIKDSGESNFPLGQFQYEVNDNEVVHNIVSPSGIYNIYEINPSNSYDLNFSVDAAYASMYSVTTSNYSNVNVVVGAGMITYNFPVTVVQPYNDLAVTIVPVNAPRPGFIYENKVVYSNLGNQAIALGTLSFNKDSNVSITAISQTGTTPTSTGFTYNFSNLLPFEVRTITVSMQVPTIPTVNAGQYLTNTASIVPLAGDVVPENNTNTLSQIIVNAYDPNDKVESRGEEILFSSFTSNDYLYYTIRFENTGTASAINVRVNDVLDAQLDETTVRMVNTSHPNYIMDRVGNIINWRFDNIQLPVSVANTAIGKGYIMFKVKPKPGYAVGDIIPNTASIYFDFNPAIVTNTFNTEFTAALALDELENGDFVFYPNPTNDFITVSLKNNSDSITSISVFDVVGKEIMNLKPILNTVNQTLDLSSVNSGMYFIEVTTENNLKVVKKVMVK
jgi:uncharacterized repeat protein (TIGR01451 family)